MPTHTYIHTHARAASRTDVARCGKAASVVAATVVVVVVVVVARNLFSFLLLLSEFGYA